MSQNTSIEWTDATWNPVRGCSRISPGCVNCYAEGIAARFSDPATEETPAGPFHLYADRNKSGSKWTGKVDLIEDKLLEPLSWRKPRRAFVNSMSDLFHEGMPDEAIDRVFAVMALTPHITHQVLTKRAHRMREYFSKIQNGGFTRKLEVCMAADAIATSGISPVNLYRPTDAWPLPNVWLGVSVEDQQAADERMPELLNTPAAVRFVSYEPALEAVDWRPYLPGRVNPHWTGRADDNPASEWGLDQIICGGESGRGARPFDIAWARQTIRQCREAGVACFVKQLGAVPIMRGCRQHHYDWGSAIGKTAKFSYFDERNQPDMWRVHLKNKKGGDMAEWPEDLRVRQFPEVRR